MNALRPIPKSLSAPTLHLTRFSPSDTLGANAAQSRATERMGTPMKKWLALMMAACLLCGCLFLTGCGKKEEPDSWKNEAYDLSLPTLGQDGWYLVFEDHFEGDGLNQNIQFGERYSGNREIWTTSPHAIRWESDDKSRPEQGLSLIHI